MMKWDRHTRILIFLGVSSVTCALSMHALLVRIQAINQCVVTHDNRLSSDVCSDITRTIEQQAFAGKNYAAIAAAVVQEFPCVEDIALHRCAPGVLHAEITSVKPLIEVNDVYVVSDRGLLMSPDYFSSALLHTLYTMRVDAPDNNVCMSPSFITTVQALTPFLLDRYDAHWVDDNKLVLQEKETSNFSLICNAQKLPDARLLAYCQQLKNDVCSKKKAQRHTHESWFADIRFEHQIILHACQGGVAHG